MFSGLIFIFLLQAKAETSYLFENYFYHSNAGVADTLINPDNSILKLPAEELGADLRAELKWRSENNQIIVRPRYQAWRNRTVAGGVTEEKNESDWDLTDAFLESQMTPELSFTTGLQVYQWGPAELMNPSNPLFHFNSRQKSFGYKEKGKVLVRANYTFTRNDSVVVVSEPVSNNDPEWTGEIFTPKALIKYEHQMADTASQFGFVAGQEEAEKKFAGAYFNWQLTESVSFFGDAKTSEEEIGFKPVHAGPFWLLEKPVDPRPWPVLAVCGVRWEGDFDVRTEYMYNSAGFTEEEWANVLDSVSNPLNPSYIMNLRNFQNLGVELPGRHYLYFSYRNTEPFEIKDLNVYVRDLYSLQDYSSQVQLEFDKAISDSWVMFGSLTASSGHKEAEFKLLNTWKSLVGVKWVL